MSSSTVSRRAQIREIEVTVTRVIPETPDTVTLELAPNGELPNYLAGQFCSIDPRQFPALRGMTAWFEQVKNRREPTRAYSMSSAPHEPLAITIKEEPFIPGQTPYPPLLSPLLVHHCVPGMKLRVQGFSGPYVLPEDIESKTSHIVHLVAGSGAVPNFSILKDSLHRGQRLRHTFVTSNKTVADVCFRQALDELAQRYADRLKVVHCVTREAAQAGLPPGVQRGRITQELIQSLVGDLDTCWAYVCGPAITSWERRAALQSGTSASPRFLETVLGFLHTLGMGDKRIKRESYG